MRLSSVALICLFLTCSCAKKCGKVSSLPEDICADCVFDDNIIDIDMMCKWVDTY